MGVCYFSQTAVGNWVSAESTIPGKSRIYFRPRSSELNFPISKSPKTLLLQRGASFQKERCLKIACGQKLQIPVLQASSIEEIYDRLAERLIPTAAEASNPTRKYSSSYLLNYLSPHNTCQCWLSKCEPEIAWLWYIVGLAAPPGAGKSTLAHEVVRRINKLWPQRAPSFNDQVEAPEVAVVLPMDGFHLYRHQLDDMENPEEAHARRGAPWTFDPARLKNCLKNLREHGSIYAPSFDHGVGDPKENDVFISLQHKVVIVEGNYLLLGDGIWKELSSMFDEKWFIDIEIDKSMQRVLKRHIFTGKPPDVAKWRVEYNDRPNAELILHSKKNANLIIKSVDLTS